MKIVINVPEKVYNHFCRGCRFFDEVEEAIIAITDGTPLPKGHGRLIDADALLDTDRLIVDSMKCHYIPMMNIYDAQTIIEADKEEGSEE